MPLDIELSWQGMERERRLVGRINRFFTVKSWQFFTAKILCKLNHGVAVMIGKGRRVVSESLSRFYVVI